MNVLPVEEDDSEGGCFRLASDERLRAAATTLAGGRIALCVLPEAVRVGSPPHPNEAVNRVGGKPVRSVFLCELVELMFSLRDGSELVARGGEHSFPPLEGDAVELWWDVEKTRAIADR